ncbi:MAG: metallophosphoesterase [Patescibacteria group bacterium]|nr:metallophosphoesterase [Patescibacteria group bacterium]
MDLFVGDLHVQIGNLEDSKRLLEFIKHTFIENKCNRLIFLGDIFHTHAVVRQEVAYLIRSFIKDFFYGAVGADKSKIIILAGNHDGASPTTTEYNAADLILSEFATVVGGENLYVTNDGYVFVPFIYDSKKFLDLAKSGFDTALKFSDIPILVCHQTFNGAAYENGMPCPDGVDANLLPYEVVISGHIHKRQVVADKVLYLGTPRQTNFSEANEDKFVFLARKLDGKKISLIPVKTNHIVKNFYCFELKEGDSLEIDFDGIDMNKDDVRIRVIGTESFYELVKERYSDYAGLVKFIPVIQKQLSKKIDIEKQGTSIESALEKYVKEVADLDDKIRDEVWKTIVKML